MERVTSKCDSCGGEHTDEEVGRYWGHNYAHGKCPVTKRHLVWDGYTDYYLHHPEIPVPNKWIPDTSYDMGSNCFEIVPKSNVYYGTVFNRGINNTCILFNKEKEWIVIDHDEKIVTEFTEEEKIAIDEVVENTLNTFKVFRTDKTIYGEEARYSAYLIPQLKGTGDSYDISELQEQYFNTHCSRPKDADIFREAYNKLVKIPELVFL